MVVKHSPVSQQIVSQSAKHELDRNEPKYLYSVNHIFIQLYTHRLHYSANFLPVPQTRIFSRLAFSADLL
jgi:NADH dehydrogenase/NADH:ubiquinone oxidoreductase subunit G